MRCPKCGNRAGDVPVCPRCEYVLDPSFLEMLDDDDDDDDDVVAGLEVADAGVPPPLADGGSGEGDPVILGDGGGDLDAFLSDQTGSFQIKEGGGMIIPAPPHISGDSQAYLKSHAVLALREGVDLASLGLSPFEQHVAGLINGMRPVARVRVKSDLSSDDLRIALAMLIDRGILELRGFLKKPPGTDALVAAPSEAKRGQLPANNTLPPELQALLDVEDDDDVSPFGEESLPPAVVNDLLEPPPADLPPLRPALRPTAAAGVPVPPLPGMGVPAPASAAPTAASAPAPARPRPPPERRSAPLPVVDPRHAKAEQLYEAAMQDLQEGKASRAKAYAEMALAEHPESERYQELLKNWGSALAGAREPIPPKAKALIDEARALEKAADFDGAARLLKRAARDHPGTATVFNRLGVLQLTRLKDADAAKTSLVRACELSPENLVYRHNLGKVLGKPLA